MICPFCFNGSSFFQPQADVFQCRACKVKIVLSSKKIEIFKDGLRSVYRLISKKTKRIRKRKEKG